MTTLADLLTTRSSLEILEEIIEDLQNEGFQATTWQDGSVAHTLVRLMAEAESDLELSRYNIAKGGVLSLSEGAWLTLYAASAYGETRSAAVNTLGYCTLTNAATGVPRSIGPFEVWVGTADGYRFVNTTSGTLAVGGTLQLEFEAESPGVAWNVSNGTITTMHTALAGVTVNNPDPGSGSWILRAGAEEESDTSLRTACQEKWPTLGYGMTKDAYSYHAKNASTSTPITRTLVVRSADWQVKVYLADSDGSVSPSDVAIVDSVLDARAPLCVDVIAVSTVNQDETVEASLYLSAGYDAATAAQAGQAALAVRFSTVPIGDGTADSVLYRAQLIEDLMGVTGMLNVVLTTPALDITPTLYRVLHLSSHLFHVYVGGIYIGDYS